MIHHNKQMKETVRCCISCIIPCGAFDVIRIVHVNGHVEELAGPLVAADIIAAHPKHVLKKHDVASKSVRTTVLPPSAALERGKIYFLVPVSTNSPKAEKRKRKKRVEASRASDQEHKTQEILSDRYLSEILSEQRVLMPRDRRRGRVGVWRPHLESIEEAVNDSYTSDDLSLTSFISV